jgi:hypothetical protein
MTETRDRGSAMPIAIGFPEPLAVWALFASCWAAVLVTYSRFPADELYAVTGSGLEGGASRLLVFLNFPTALAAIALVAVVYERLPGRALRVLAVAAILLCLPVFWPGVVSQSHLDARPVNAVAAIGAGLALLVTLAAEPGGERSGRGDRARIAIAAVALAAAPAWVAAELGFYLNGVPLLGRLYLSGQHRPEQSGSPALAAVVHHGDHHGLNGVLLVLTALLLSRTLAGIRSRGLRSATAGYLSLMLAYGLGNIANDFWTEQIDKRGWTRWGWPSVLEPRLGWPWLLLLVLAAAVWLVWFGQQQSVVSPDR